jgi:hypothetical protein
MDIQKSKAIESAARKEQRPKEKSRSSEIKPMAFTTCYASH